MIENFDDRDRHKTVAWLSALVSLGIIDIGEFMSVMISLESGYVGNEDLSSRFLIELAEFYLIAQTLPK